MIVHVSIRLRIQMNIKDHCCLWEKQKLRPHMYNIKKKNYDYHFLYNIKKKTVIITVICRELMGLAYSTQPRPYPTNPVALLVKQRCVSSVWGCSHSDAVFHKMLDSVRQATHQNKNMHPCSPKRDDMSKSEKKKSIFQTLEA